MKERHYCLAVPPVRVCLLPGRLGKLTDRRTYPAVTFYADNVSRYRFRGAALIII